jgi:hypothetical protein
MTEDPAKQAWQASVEVAGGPPLEDVRKGADRLYRAVTWRNRIEYVACAVVIVVFSYYLFTMEHILHKLGSVATIVAAIYAPWQLHRRASAVAPEMAGTMPIYAFARGQLVRQRDALKSIFGWYILPFLPRLALMIAGNGLDPRIEAAGPPHWARWLALGVIVAIFAGIWWINQLGARRLQKRIDEIDALTGEGA